MQFLSFFLFIFILSAQAAAPDCTRLKKIAEDLEKNIQTKRIATDCEKIDPKSLGLPDQSIGFPNFSKKSGVNADWDYRCKDFSALETQLKSIENEIALLNGISGLKNDIKQGLETIKKFPNQNIAKEASAEFIKNLELAKSIETFLASNNLKSENILSKIVADPIGWTDMNSFAGLLRKHCGEFLGLGTTVCTKGFVLTEDTFKELNDFILLGKKTDRKFNKQQVKQLKEAISIKKGEEDYSFDQLSTELKGIQANGLLAAEDMQKINALPPLSDGSNFKFIKNLKNSIKNLQGSQELVSAQGTPERFSALLEDLKNRQEWEMKSKISLVLSTNAAIPESDSAACMKARVLDGPISDCLDAVIKNDKVPQLQKSILTDLKNEFRYGEQHLFKLSEMLKDCVPDANLNYPPKCDTMVSVQMAELVEKAQYLNALKAKHLQSSPDLIVMRNFALEKLHSSKGCMNAGESTIRECSQDIGPISREALTLTGDAKEILYIFEKPKSDTDIAHVCDEGTEKVSYKDELCDLADEDLKNKEDKINADTFQASVDPETRDNTRDSIIDFGKSLLQNVASAIAPRPQPMMPQAPIFPYVPPGPPAMDISSKIMAPYVSHGYGSYYPTQGLRPYSSVNSNVGTYSAYNFGSSSHFNSPVGW